MGSELKLQARDAEALREFAGKVRSLLDERLVGLKLFGSKARGDDVPGSDIDVAVIITAADPVVKDQVVDIAFDVNLVYGVYLSPRVIPCAVLEDPVWRITPFLQAVEREGVLL